MVFHLHPSDLELPSGGENKKTRALSKSEPDTPTLPLATPDYAAGLGVDYSPMTPAGSVPSYSPTTPGPSSMGGSEGASNLVQPRGALELALHNPMTPTSVKPPGQQVDIIREGGRDEGREGGRGKREKSCIRDFYFSIPRVELRRCHFILPPRPPINPSSDHPPPPPITPPPSPLSPPHHTLLPPPRHPPCSAHSRLLKG